MLSEIHTCQVPAIDLVKSQYWRPQLVKVVNRPALSSQVLPSSLSTRPLTAVSEPCVGKTVEIVRVIKH